jgi:hypothetical protein
MNDKPVSACRVFRSETSEIDEGIMRTFIPGILQFLFHRRPRGLAVCKVLRMAMRSHHGAFESIHRALVTESRHQHGIWYPHGDSGYGCQLGQSVKVCEHECFAFAYLPILTPDAVLMTAASSLGITSMATLLFSF